MEVMLQALPFLGKGLAITLQVSALVVLISLLAGVALGVALVYGPAPLRWLVRGYSDVIRGIPILVLIFAIYYGLPALHLNLSSLVAAVTALSMFTTAQVVETTRGALQSIHHGQMEAGKAIGLTPWQRLLHVRLPTMFRVSLPSLSNTFVSLFKDTSVASVIAVPELAYAAQWINFNTFRIVEVYAVVTPIYLVTGYTILFLLRRLERRYAVRT